MEAVETRHLDPKTVRPSRWANRHESSFSNRDFAALKIEIAGAGGNVQPIKVRAAQDGYFEIVFGHRRHRACQELGLPLLATVVALDDRSLWEEMERENRSRANLSPFEQGRQYKTALDAGLYSSIRRLASAIGVDISQAAKMIRIAALPEEVIAAFDSPNDIQVKWISDLDAAHNRDPSGLIARAKAIREKDGPRPSPKVIFAELVSRGVEPFHTQKLVIRNAARQEVATISRSQTGYSIEIKTTDLKIAEVEVALQKLLGA